MAVPPLSNKGIPSTHPKPKAREAGTTGDVAGEPKVHMDKKITRLVSIHAACHSLHKFICNKC